MSRADGAAYPPLPSDTEVRGVRQALRPSMGEVDWSIEQIVVGEHVHLLAVCHCEDCRQLRENAAREHAGDKELFDVWDDEDEHTRRAWHSEMRSTMGRREGKSA